MICFRSSPTELDDIWNYIIGIGITLIIGLLLVLSAFLVKTIKVWKDKAELRPDYKEISIKQYDLLSIVSSYSDVQWGIKAIKLLERYKSSWEINKWKYANKFNEILKVIANGSITTLPPIKDRALELVNEFDAISVKKKGK